MAIKILLGGSGFIGHHLGVSLCSEHQVIVIDNHRTGETDLTRERESLLRRAGANIINLDSTYVSEALERIRYDTDEPVTVFHLANHQNQAAVIESGSNDAMHNMCIKGKSIVNACEQYDAKLIYFSSSMVYGNFKSPTIDELHSTIPTTEYGQLKKKSEFIFREYTGSIIVRPIAVYGPRDDNNRVLSKWNNLLENGSPIQVHNPYEKLDFTHVNDVVRKVITLDNTPAARGETYNISCGTSVACLDAARLIGARYNVSHLHTAQILDHNSQVRGALCNEKYKRVTGDYTPSIPLEKGIWTL